ncbi:MAG: CbtA family protein [Minwuia sp.]|nr:CbtA family protein [Minwuia sp.]
MFLRILTSALFAGAAAGFITALLQLAFVQPVLLHAELYDSGAMVHFESAAPSTGQHDSGHQHAGEPTHGDEHSHDGGHAHGHGHAHGDGPDLMRDGLSILFTMLTYTGYALILVAAMSVAETRGATITARTGIIWGAAGFVTFHLAPGFSLAPEVPGVAAADIGARQIWWFATVATAAVGIWLIAFGRNWMAWGAAALLLLAPHVVGAPEPDVLAGPVPPEIAALFASRAFGVGLAAWVMVGCLAGYFWRRRTIGTGTVLPG